MSPCQWPCWQRLAQVQESQAAVTLLALATRWRPWPARRAQLETVGANPTPADRNRPGLVRQTAEARGQGPTAADSARTARNHAQDRRPAARAGPAQRAHRSQVPGAGLLRQNRTRADRRRREAEPKTVVEPALRDQTDPGAQRDRRSPALDSAPIDARIS